MSVYQLDVLIQETRRLAAAYYKTTKQVLPVSNEIAKHDACRLLNLNPLSTPLQGVDAHDANGQSIQVKSRVIFKEKQSGYRIGQLNMEGAWQAVVLVLLDLNYEPMAIYRAEREHIEAALSDQSSPNRQHRGVMSVGKFKAISQCSWNRDGVT